MRLIVMLSLAALVGCQNPYSKYYTGYAEPSAGTGYAGGWYIPHDGEPTVYQGGDIDKDSNRMLEQGYVLLGKSGFNAAGASTSQATEKARELKAETVLLYSKYARSETSVVPFSVPDTQTSYGTGTIHGPDGSSTVSGTVTTYGSTTTYAPITTHRYDFRATFWAKGKRGGLGIYIDDLNAEQRRQIGSNKGAVISIVIKDEKAYQADVISGDIIIEIGGKRVRDKEDADRLLAPYYGQRVTMVLNRNGQNITKEIDMDPRPE